MGAPRFLPARTEGSSILVAGHRTPRHEPGARTHDGSAFATAGTIRPRSRAPARETPGTVFAVIEGMKIEPWMKRPVITVKPHDSARHAREVMERHRINQLPVVVDGHLVGIVTDRDLRDAFPSVFESAEPFGRRHREPGTDPATIPVEDVMSPNVITLAPDAFLPDAARLMRRERIGAIPVVDHGQLVGILTRSDVLDAFVEVSESTLGLE